MIIHLLPNTHNLMCDQLMIYMQSFIFSPIDMILKYWRENKTITKFKTDDAKKLETFKK